MSYIQFVLKKGDDGLDFRAGLVFAVWNTFGWKVLYCFAFSSVKQIVLSVDIECLALRGWLLEKGVDG